MITRALNVTLAGFFLSAIALAPRAEADIFDRIFDAAQVAKDRAREARDKAAEAGNTAKEIRDRILAGVRNLSEDAFSRILGTAQEVRDKIAEEKAELEELKVQLEQFRAGGCEDCRERLIEGLIGLQTVVNQLGGDGFTIPCPGIQIGGNRPDIDLDPLIRLIEGGDCKILFPICVAFGGLVCVLEDLQEVASALQTIQDLVGDRDTLVGKEDPASQPPVTFMPPLDESDPALTLDAQRFAARRRASHSILLHYDEIYNANLTIKGAVWSLNKLIDQFEANEKDNSATLGIHGYILINIDLDRGRKLKKYLGWVTTGLEFVTGLVDKKLTEANNVSATALVISNQIYISQQLAQTLDANKGDSTAALKNGGSTALALDPVGCGNVGLLPLTVMVAGVALLRWSPRPTRAVPSSDPQESHQVRS